MRQKEMRMLRWWTRLEAAIRARLVGSFEDETGDVAGWAESQVRI